MAAPFRAVLVSAAASWLRARVARFAPLLDAAASERTVDAIVTDVAGGFDAGATVARGLYHLRVPVLCLHPADAPDAASSSLSSFLRHPLLSVGAYRDESEVDALLTDFFYVPETPGRVFTIEGGDGTGKQTQSEMLVERLRREGFPVKTLDFPNDEALGGRNIRAVLAGQHGPISRVHPMLFAGLYATNRFDLAPVLRHWVRKGQNIVLDRYMEANWGYQAVRFESMAEREQAVQSLRTFEVEWLGLPPSHRVLLLQLSVEAARAAMASRAELDQHERDDAYARRVREAFEWCAQTQPGWIPVQCADERNQRYSREVLHERIFSALRSEFVNQNDVRALHA